jgi:hypothetical protein
VKNTDIKNNQYLDHIRETHDPALHIKTLEDELKGTIGKALGKQGDKVLYHLRLMEQERQRYQELISNHHHHHHHHHSSDEVSSSNTKLVNEICKCVEKHNEYREQAKTARWELLVHRQAVGFLVDNHRFVHETFPIGDALPEYRPEEEGRTEQDDEMSQQQQKESSNILKDQLDWWQRIGRWK